MESGGRGISAGWGASWGVGIIVFGPSLVSLVTPWTILGLLVFLAPSAPVLWQSRDLQRAVLALAHGEIRSKAYVLLFTLHFPRLQALRHHLETPLEAPRTSKCVACHQSNPITLKP